MPGSPDHKIASELLSLAPNPIEAQRVFRSALEAEWWRGLGGKRSGWFKSRIEKWALATLREIGLKPYQSLAWIGHNSVGVAAKARDEDSFRLLMVGVSELFEVKHRVVGKARLPLAMMVFYASMHRKNARIVDSVLPRVKRKIIAPSRIMVVKRMLDSIGSISHRRGSLLEPRALDKEVDADIIISGEISVTHPKKGSLAIKYIDEARCTKGIVEYEEYRAKYIILIPPIIAWKWTSYLIPTSILAEEKDGEVGCHP